MTLNKRFTKISITTLGLSAAALFLSGAHVQWPTGAHAEDAVYFEKAAASRAVTVPADVRALSQAFTTLTEEVSPTVVNIYTKSGAKPQRGMEEMDNPFPFMQIPREALGSGFVVNADQGYIITNAHVVRMAGQNADEIMVKFIGEDGEATKGHLAKVVGADEISDVALLKLVEKKPGLKAAPLGDSASAKVGEWVLAIGNPYGHSHTVTQGIVSATGRSLEGARSEFLQTSAGINPGNSGGPLINMNGEVIGINSAMDPRAQNIGFAIPINTAKDVVAQLVKGGKVQRAWMGIAIEDVSEEAAGLLHLKEKGGVLVRQVMPNAPAAQAGLENYDVIRKIDGQEVNNTRDLYKSMEKLSAGKVAEIQVLRGAASKTLKVKLGEAPTKT